MLGMKLPELDTERLNWVMSCNDHNCHKGQNGHSVLTNCVCGYVLSPVKMKKKSICLRKQQTSVS